MSKRDRFAQRDVVHSDCANEKLYLIRGSVEISHDDGDDDDQRRRDEEYDMQNGDHEFRNRKQKASPPFVRACRRTQHRWMTSQSRTGVHRPEMDASAFRLPFQCPSMRDFLEGERGGKNANAVARVMIDTGARMLIKLPSEMRPTLFPPGANVRLMRERSSLSNLGDFMTIRRKVETN